MKRKEAMKKAKETGKPQRVTEPEATGETKVLVSVRLDLDVLNDLKERSAKERIPYSTLLNSLLRKSMAEEGDFEARLKRIEKKLKMA